eukprot:TRINITY_DN36865_c0_g1_i2.p1 TRINITY_DN36865_c0_g1~~TRINITY_DN36865_c0_g1_i2.p1  ORF type:complete len:218 (-),score=41.71 TRINITY_DN36865_c0_g1_i2:1-654(-)
MRRHPGRRPLGLCLSLVVSAVARPQRQPSDSIQQEIEYIWPMKLLNVQLAGSPGRPGLEDDSFSEGLAEIALKGYRRYVEKILPRELEANPDFAKEFREADVSRTNRAFMRWQTRIFSGLARLPISELVWDGKPMQQVPGVPYEWDAWFKSNLYKRMRGRVKSMCQELLSAKDDRHAEQEIDRGKVFLYAEVLLSFLSSFPGCYHLFLGAYRVSFSW